MKNRIFLVLILALSMVFIADEVKAETCSPSGDYTTCYVNSDYDGYAKIQTTGMYRYLYDGKRYISRDITVECTGDRLYLYNGKGNIDCGPTGCSGVVNSWADGTRTIEIDSYAPISPAFVCWDGFSNDGYVWQSNTWSYVYYAQVQECTTDAACGETEFCDDSNPYEITCANLNCASDEIIIDHKCVTPEIPTLCQNAGITDYYECQIYLAEHINDLQGDLQTKVDQINQLEADIDEKAEIINQLTTDLEVKAQIIENLTTKLEERKAYIEELTTNIDEQTQIINSLENTIEEKAVIIAGLQEEIQNQAQMINELTDNLEEKAVLVKSLQVENERQAELISEMESSFERQADIISRMNNTIEEDADIITSMNESLEHKAQLIKELRLKLEDEQELVKNLRLTVEDQETIVANLRRNLNETQSYVDELELNEDRLQDKIDRLETRNTAIYIFFGVAIATFVGAVVYVRRRRRK